MRIMRLLRRLRWFWQRGRRGWADGDVWSLDYYLARVIAESVEYLRRTNHGNPCLGTPPRDCENCDCSERYDSALWTISKGFQAYWDSEKLSWQGDWGKQKEAAMEAALRESLRLLAEHFRSLWD